MRSFILFIASLSTAIAVPRPENPVAAHSTLDQSPHEAPLSGKSVKTNVAGRQTRDTEVSTSVDSSSGDSETNYNDIYTELGSDLPPENTNPKSTGISMADT